MTCYRCGGQGHRRSECPQVSRVPAPPTGSAQAASQLPPPPMQTRLSDEQVHACARALRQELGWYVPGDDDVFVMTPFRQRYKIPGKYSGQLREMALEQLTRVRLARAA